MHLTFTDEKSKSIKNVIHFLSSWHPQVEISYTIHILSILTFRFHKIEVHDQKDNNNDDDNNNDGSKVCTKVF
jgi:hypothetical protein